MIPQGVSLGGFLTRASFYTEPGAVVESFVPYLFGLYAVCAFEYIGGGRGAVRAQWGNSGKRETLPALGRTMGLVEEDNAVAFKLSFWVVRGVWFGPGVLA